MIDLIDPSTLTQGASEGPQTWGEAWSRVAETTDDTMRLIENTNADSDALERAYDQRIAAIRDLTGTQLPNPLRVASGVDREMIDIFAMQAAGGGTLTPSQVSPDFRQRQEEEFNERARALSDRFPQIEGIISKPVMEQRNQVMRDAEAASSAAAQSPELGMVGRLSAGLVGGLKGAAKDPAQWGMAFLGAGGGTAKTVGGRIGQTVLQEALLNGGQELVLQGLSQERKRAAGLEHGLGDMLANAGVAATFGAIFGGTVQGGAELARVFKLGEGGAERAARVIEGRPEPGDVEAIAKAMNVELGPEKLDLLNRSFEERVLDDVMVPTDGDAGAVRVFEAARRYAEDPDNNPPPDLIERLVADEDAARMKFSPDEYERMFAGDQNAIDDIADTFMSPTIDDAVRRIDAVADRVDAVAARVDDISMEDEIAQMRRDRVLDGGTLTEGGHALKEVNGVLLLKTLDESGDLSLSQVGNDLKVGVASVSSARRGQGVARKLYEEAVHMAAARGGVLRSDLSVSNDAVRVYRSLERRGYDVRMNPRATKEKKGMIGSVNDPNGNWVFEVRLPDSDPIKSQTIAPARAVEPFDAAAEQIADVQAGEIVEPARDANGNPENYLDFVGVEDGDGNIKIMSTAEALAMADEPEFFAELLEACKL